MAQVDSRMEKLNQMREEALLAGGQKAIDRQHAKGSLTARERLIELLDESSFRELDAFAVSQDDPGDNPTLGDGVVIGYGKIDGRTPDLKAVRVSFRRLSETKTEMQIKVDSFGDSELTHIIYDKFKIALDPSN